MTRIREDVDLYIEIVISNIQITLYDRRNTIYTDKSHSHDLEAPG